MWEKHITDIIMLSPFMARSLLSLPMEEDNTQATIATNGHKILWNQTFIDSITTTECTGVIVHEVLHVILGHHVRQGHRNSTKWNIACDYEVNPIVEQAGYSLPDGMLYNIAYENMPAEDIYDLLPDVIEESMIPEWGQVIADDSEQAYQNWQEATAGTMWNNLPDTLKIKLNNTLVKSSKVGDIIAQFVNQLTTGTNDTWSPPSRRNTLLPSLEQITTGYVICCIDTSGSISIDQITEFAGYVLGVADVARIDVIFGDAEVTEIIKDIHNADEVNQAFEKIKGGGGTNFAPLITEADNHYADAIIYFTDGYGDFGKKPITPILWCLTENSSVPWGQVMQI